MPEPSVLADEGWFNNRWRPSMAWLWFSISACDFIIFPVLNALAAGAKMIPYAPWSPMTLQGGGLIHLAMGGVVGVAAWRRSDEKMAIYNTENPPPPVVTVEKTNVTIPSGDSPVTTTKSKKSSRSD